MDIQFEEDGKCPAFLAFAKSRPQDETVNIGHPRECAIAQFLRTEYPNAVVYAEVWFEEGGWDKDEPNNYGNAKGKHELPHMFETRVYGQSWTPGDSTSTWAEIVARMEA